MKHKFYGYQNRLEKNIHESEYRPPLKIAVDLISKKEKIDRKIVRQSKTNLTDKQ